METCRNCGAELSPDIDWCGQCFTPVRRWTRRNDDIVVVPDAREGRSFGIPERLLFSALIVAVGIVGFVALTPAAGRIGSTAWGAVAAFLATYTVLGLVALWLTWRPAPRERRPEHVVVIGGTVIRVPDLIEGTGRP
jgi:hypothetical protein